MNMLKDKKVNIAHKLQQYLAQQYSPKDKIFLSKENFLFLNTIASNAPTKQVLEKKSLQTNAPTINKPPISSPRPSNYKKKNEILEEKTTKPKPKLEILPNALNDQFEDIEVWMRQTYPQIQIKTNLYTKSTYDKEQAVHFSLPSLDTDVLLLSSKKDTQEHLFLSNVAKAINLSLTSCSFVAIESLFEKYPWEEILQKSPYKLVIISSKLLRSHSSTFLKHYDKQSKIFSLEKMPSMLINSTTTYTNSFDLKKQLWETIKLKISSHE
jgi:hypothetical protein